jgi:hypothetical protein
MNRFILFAMLVTLIYFGVQIDQAARDDAAREIATESGSYGMSKSVDLSHETGRYSVRSN